MKLLNRKYFPISASILFFLVILIGFKIFFGEAPGEKVKADFYLSPDKGYTIQEALKLAKPGQVIYLLPGTYYQDIVSVRSGTASLPIKITGSKDAIVKGGGNGRVFEINHSYIILDGFTIDGLYGEANKKEGYRDILVYVVSKENKSGVKGLKILNMDLRNSGGECVRLKYFSKNNEIAYNNIENCGIYDFKFNGGGKNGEGIYIGTAPEQLDRNPTQDIDNSNDNYIHHNKINTQGNEGVDIKEGASGNIVEYNSITGQTDPESGGLDSRGDGNIFRYNEISNCVGAGIRIGGDTIGQKEYGKNNEIYQNKIHGCEYGAVKIQTLPQRKICGNEVSGNGPSLGDYSSQISLTAVCN